ncbi:glycosyltransferase [Acidithiobacillus sp.]|jgi:GT2 family glycosyltransferase|uniref:glycosyltransferase n=1 Tax=Acidithiobacillus sp. TaxID=1872118 RepID=UPI0025C016FE|nr:glycosyltransferase [Acidithiobacillus sp.]MCK9187595.1 glycosyltransferase [Acidithiobacillus sp.]MCK9358485.1 glycosyltransferase [Acidithiobacillus sp.]
MTPVISIVVGGGEEQKSFGDVVELLSAALQDLGFHILTGSHIRKGCFLNIVLCAHLLERFDFSEDNIVIYNFEQVDGNSQWFDTGYMDLLKKYIVWDYSQVNIKNLEAHGIDNIVHVPLGYHRCLERVEKKNNKDIDILFYGAVNARRKKIIDELLGMNVAVVAVTGVYGVELDKLLERSKVVVNIHYYDAKIFEQVRACYLLSNALFLLSESGSDPIETEFSEGVRFCSYEQIIDVALEALSDDEMRCRVSSNGYELIKRKSESKILEKAISFYSKELDKFVDIPSIINLGSGKDWRDEFLNIDINDLFLPDIKCDFSESIVGQTFSTSRFGPVVLGRNMFEQIMCNDVLEHVHDLVMVMTNCIEILTCGGILQVHVPYDLSWGAWQDPTHVRAFNERSWLYYTEWFWYIGWNDYRFDVVELEFHLSDVGRSLSSAGIDFEEIKRTARAVDSMTVTLRKRFLTRQEIESIPLFRGSFERSRKKQEVFSPYEAQKTTEFCDEDALYETNPLVSIIILTLNRPEMLRRALRSVYAQSYRNLEVMVLNDGGEPVESVLVDTLHEVRFSYLSFSENGGQALRRNQAIQASHGDIIVYLDDDDVYQREHVEIIIQHMRSGKYDFCYTESDYVIEKEIAGEFREISRAKQFGNCGYSRDRLLVANFIPICCWGHTRKIFDDTGGFCEDFGGNHEDWEFLLRISERFVVSHVPKITVEVHHRVEADNSLSKIANFSEIYEKVYRKFSDITPEVELERQNTLSRLCSKVFAGSYPLQKRQVSILNSNVKYCNYDESFSEGLGHAAFSVILHLYYVDLWPEFLAYLKRIDVEFELFVSLTREGEFFLNKIKQDFPSAHIFVFKNIGRDILPRLELARSAIANDAKYLLFLHSKKSPHLKDLSEEQVRGCILEHRNGDQWRFDLLQRLADPEAVEKILARFDKDPKLGLVGPAGYWLLLANQPLFPAFQKLKADLALADRGDDGFFAGSMFWARSDALRALFDLPPQSLAFEEERGQVDHTLAHAFERVFTLVAGQAGYTAEDTAGRVLCHAEPAIVPWLHDQPWFLQGKQWAQAWFDSHPQPTRLGCVLVGDKNKKSACIEEYLVTQWASFADVVECPKKRDLLLTFNIALKALDADWISLLDAGDQLSPDASFRIQQAIARHPEWQLIYTDEDSLTADGQHVNPHCKPDMNIDYLRSLPYVGGLLVIKKSLFEQLGGFDPQADGAEDYDFVLRAWELLGDVGIGHIPQVLYHRLQGSGHCDKSIVEILAASKAALERHLARLGIAASVESGPFPPSTRVRYPLPRQPLVSILIPTRNQVEMLQRCVESIIEKTHYPHYEILIIDNDSDEAEARTYLDLLRQQEAILSDRLQVIAYPGPFNFSAMNNAAVKQARGEFILLLNNDTAVLHEDWLEEMMSHALRQEVGIVGAKLLFPDSRIQHAGVILGMRGPAEHPFIGQPADSRGYFGRAMLTQDLSAVTGACLLISKNLYEQVGALDEQAFQVSYNDVDLCLKVREQGKKIIFTPWAILLHEGSASQRGAVEQKPSPEKEKRFVGEKMAFYRKWLPQLAFDPAYNRQLSLASTDFLIEGEAALTWDPEWRPRPRILVHPADREGCGEYRIISPMRALRAAGRVQGWETMRIFEPAEMERFSPDSIVLQRQMEWPQIEALERHKRLHTAFRVFEIDDLITNLPVKSVHKGQIHKDIAKRFRKAAGFCDRLVVATEPLAQAYKGFSDEVRVQPNCVERAVWGDLLPRRRGGAKPRVGWAGGVGHTGDLELVADVVRDLANAVEWVFFGLCPEALRPYVHEFHPGVPLPQYPAKLASLDLDLAIAPLEENPFNDAKSHLRILEYGVLGFPVVCSNITPYQGDFPVWRVANRYRDWMKAIREAISDRAALAAAGDALRDQVRARWMLEDRLDDWLQAWLP